ncbi:phage portal protein [Janibacter melonis]|uniref:phage portal protein n=1 Tax=Janibacter melonis TaxID=262209 RepID=UPI002042BDB0|nr:phage portal protein [Janibacter melonis]MCM3554007.1 phage portal protein [Janibacter melonis]
MTDHDHLTASLQHLDEKAATYSQLTAYYEGRQPLTFLSPEARESLNNRLAAVSVNIPRLLVDSIAERLRITGCTRPDVWADWRANDLDTMHRVAHREALLLGDAFVIVWARPDGSPLVTVESATQVAVQTDPATREVLSAVKRWEAPDGTHAVHYGPDSIETWHSPGKGATTTGFRKVSTIDNPLGAVPVVWLRNGDRLVDRGISEMTDVLPLTDALVKLSTDMLTASEYAARPRRWASGVELIEDGDGNVINPFPETDRMMISEAHETKFGQLAGTDLAGYEAAVNVVMRQISAVSGLPEHLLGIGGDNPTSADSIRASEAALTARAEARQGTYGKAWDRVGQLMAAVRNGVSPDSVDVRMTWADPSTRSVAQEADAVVKLHAAGILPTTYALARLGYDASEIEAIRVARRSEALDTAGVDLAGLVTS